jgi:hypothetical protein
MKRLQRIFEDTLVIFQISIYSARPVANLRQTAEENPQQFTVITSQVQRIDFEKNGAESKTHCLGQAPETQTTGLVKPQDSHSG